MDKIPYNVPSGVYTPAGAIPQFNGMSFNDSLVARINSQQYVCRAPNADDTAYRYFYKGKEYQYSDLFLD